MIYFCTGGIAFVLVIEIAICGYINYDSLGFAKN